MMRDSYHFLRAESLLHSADLDEHPFYNSLTELMLFSQFACKQMPDLINMLKQDDGLTTFYTADYEKILGKLDFTVPQHQYCKQLRIIRHQQMLRLILRELSGLASSEQTLKCWSDFADVVITKTIVYAKNLIAKKHGLPIDKNNHPANLITLAMGKLGGQELNFSSDIDLIFIFDCHGKTQGSHPISNQEFFTKVVQLFSQIIHQRSQEGIVFRVDMRLRPHGDSGSLVLSIASMETYYQEQGRDWERYAMVKCRIIDTLLPFELRKKVDGVVIPFVFKRYVDFSVIESLRGMKSLIEREIELNPRLDDIKRGKGGIREIEFVVQGAQIIWGGRMPQLRVKPTISALSLLKSHKLLKRCDALTDSYLFFRKLENILQVKGDQQTHSLPKDELSLVMLAKLMRFNNVNSFLKRLNQHQHIVSQIFRSFLGKQHYFEDSKRVIIKQIQNLWEGHIEINMAIHLLASLTFDDPKRCFHLINDFSRSHRVKKLNQLSRMRLSKLMVMIILDLSKQKNQALITLRLIHLLESIVGRGTYLALLTENFNAIQNLIYYFGKSDFISQLIVQYPFLLEALLETKSKTLKLPSRNELDQILEGRFKFNENVEDKIELIKQFKLESWTLVARAMIHRYVPVIRVGRYLADVAQVIVNKLVVLAVKQLIDKHPRLQRISSYFAVLCYGKVGSRELNFDSDLDLVFVHKFQANDEPLAIRLSQHLIRMLTTRSQTGILYNVDTRLRPSGSAGLLVIRWDAFAQYQQSQAWTWEHQALLKARVLFGSRNYHKRILTLKQSVINQRRNEEQLATAVIEMRSKIGYKSVDKEDIKKSPGGLLDIEFLIQYLVLSKNNTKLAKYTHSMSLLQQLYVSGVINKEEFGILRTGWYKAHQSLQMKSIGIKATVKSYPFKEIENIYRSFVPFRQARVTSPI